MYLFAEFDDAANLLAANPDATTISIDEPVEIPKNQNSHLQEPGREEDDELLGTDDSDKTEVMLSPLWWGPVRKMERDFLQEHKVTRRENGFTLRVSLLQVLKRSLL